MTVAPIDGSSVDLSLHNRLKTRHKELFTSVVMPVIIISTVFLLISHWRNDAKFYSGLAVCLALDVFNVYFSIKNRVVKFADHSFYSRSDGFDTFRWCVNLVLDVYLVYALELSMASALAIWLILTFGALTEVFERKNRFVTAGFAAIGMLCVLFVQDVNWVDFFYLFVSFIGLTVILIQLERWVVREMYAYHEEQTRKEIYLQKSESLAKEALVGSQARTIIHEVNNLLFIIKNASSASGHGNDAEDPRMIQIARSVEILSGLSVLVLDDLPNKGSLSRSCSLHNLERDLRVLLVKHFRKDRSATVKLNWHSTIEGNRLCFSELPGTTYLIIHNIVKNAVEAVRQKHPDGSGLVEILSEVTERSLKIEIRDNGPGLTAGKIEAIIEERMCTEKSLGHGLGLKFALQYIRRNGFQISIDSKVGESALFSITIPLSSEEDREKMAS